MSSKIALCADIDSLRDPNELGIIGEDILDQNWIIPFADACMARKYLRDHQVAETWVISSESVDGINLAAALKKDNASNNVKLLVSSPSGSEMSRCQSAGITPICGSHEFAHLYTKKKMDSSQTFGLSGALKDQTVQVRRINREPERAVETIEIDEISDIANIEEPPPLAATSAENMSIVPQRKSITSSTEGAHIVTVISGSGGTGKSSLTALCSLLAQRKGIRTLVLDADFQFGDLKFLLGYKDGLNVDDILEHPEQIETLLKADTWPVLLSAPPQLEHSEMMEERITELLALLKPHFDLIVINTGAFWSELQLQLLEASNEVFFLIDQRPSSVRACNHALDLCARCGIATTSFSYLLNFCSKKSLLSSLDVSCALKGAQVHEIRDGGGEVGELLGAGMADKLSRLNNPFCSSVEKLLEATIYPRVKPSLAKEPTQPAAKSANNAKLKFFSRAKRRAACF